MPTAAERTGLAWERSAVGPLTAALLLAAKRIEPRAVVALLVAGYVLLGLVAVWFGRRRKRRIGSQDVGSEGDLTVPAAGREVAGTALAATVIALGTAVVIALHG